MADPKRKLVFLDLRLDERETKTAPLHDNDPPPRPTTADALEQLKYEKKLAIWTSNERRYALYYGLRHALPKYFCLCGPSASGPEIVPRDMMQFGCPLASGTSEENEKAEKARIAFIVIYGMMLADNLEDPLLGRAARNYATDDDEEYEVYPGETPRRMAAQYKAHLVDRVKQYKSDQETFEALHFILVDEGREGPGDPVPTEVNARHWAVVGRRLIERGIKPANPNFKRHALNALTEALGGALQGRAASTDVSLPDLDLLDAQGASDIDADNVLALSAIYFAAMLEDMKLFAVADKVAEQFISGMLPIKRGLGGQNIYDYIRSIPERFTELDRRSLYARTFGIAGGGIEEELPNRDFADLWIRALSAVSLFNRQSTSEKRLVSGPQVHKIFRDLGVNLSYHGYGLAHFGAVELQKLVNDVLAMLKAPDVLAAFGVRDVWQLVDRVSLMTLGGSVNGVRLRTMAQSGSRIIQFISKNAAALASPFALNVDAMFSDRALVDNVERWLAVTGTTDMTVEEFSEPVVASAQPTLPTLSLAQMPQQLDDALRQVANFGVPSPVGQA